MISWPNTPATPCVRRNKKNYSAAFIDLMSRRCHPVLIKYFTKKIYIVLNLLTIFMTTALASGPKCLSEQRLAGCHLMSV
ncbi:MAG: hypothetical protein ACLT90_18215 [Enterococcus raffinosus]